MKKITVNSILLMFVLLTSSFAFSEGVLQLSYEIKIHFLYGSKPKKEFKNSETKAFGGIHGGHVTIEVNGAEYGFNPTKIHVHIFPRKKRQSCYVETEVKEKPEGVNKYMTISMRISREKYADLLNLLEDYMSQSPYDYAFFGMRCAASTRDILEQLDILKDKSNFGSIRKAFYPKRLRKQLLKMVDEKGFTVERISGRSSRKWERD